MDLHIKIQQENASYDKEWAHVRSDVYKYTLEHGFKIKCANKIQFTDKIAYTLNGETADGKDVSIQFPDMTLVEFAIDDEFKLALAIEKCLIKKMQVTHNIKYDAMRYYFYIPDNVEVVNLASGVYLSKNSVPAHLLEKA